VSLLLAFIRFFDFRLRFGVDARVDVSAAISVLAALVFEGDFGCCTSSSSSKRLLSNRLADGIAMKSSSVELDNRLFRFLVIPLSSRFQKWKVESVACDDTSQVFLRRFE
jgi:hypothetical protein